MESKLVKIELNTQIGVFKFEKHWDSNVDFRHVMKHFVCNNWEMLGEISYKVFVKWADGEITTTVVDGINATSDLECYIDGYDIANV